MVGERWVCVDVVFSKVRCADEMEGRATKPVLYVIAANPDGTVKDVTMRYVKDFMASTRYCRP